MPAATTTMISSTCSSSCKAPITSPPSKSSSLAEYLDCSASPTQRDSGSTTSTVLTALSDDDFWNMDLSDLMTMEDEKEEEQQIAQGRPKSCLKKRSRKKNKSAPKQQGVSFDTNVTIRCYQRILTQGRTSSSSSSLSSYLGLGLDWDYTEHGGKIMKTTSSSSSSIKALGSLLLLKKNKKTKNTNGSIKQQPLCDEERIELALRYGFTEQEIIHATNTATTRTKPQQEKQRKRRNKKGCKESKNNKEKELQLLDDAEESFCVGADPVSKMLRAQKAHGFVKKDVSSSCRPRAA